MGKLGRAMFLALVVALTAPLCAQLNGLYTCANGNPGNAFDYGDIGDFFNDLEAQGVNGPVTLDVFDDGGPFTSTASYALGAGDAGGPFFGVAGLGGANPLITRAAAGEKPEVVGGGARLGALGYNASQPYFGAMAFANVGGVTIEGFELRNAPNWGICFSQTGSGTYNGVRISRCRIHDVADGWAITFLSGGFDGVIIENNMIWACGAVTPSITAPRGVVRATVGLEWIVRHNTILHVDAIHADDAIWLSGSSVEQFHSNVVYITSTIQPPAESVFAVIGRTHLRRLQRLPTGWNRAIWGRHYRNNIPRMASGGQRSQWPACRSHVREYGAGA